MSKVALLSALLLAVSIHYAQGGGGTPCDTENITAVRIGELPTLFHDVSGVLYALTEYDFCISSFTYDGNGPDAFLYFYFPGDAINDTGGGVIIPLTTDSDDNRDQFVVGRAYDNEILRFSLPEHVFRGCNFEGFGIWCRYASQLFTNITWSTDDIYSIEGAPGRVTCNPSPGRGYVGKFPTLDNGVGGQIYVRDNKSFVIRNFRYDGQGPDAFVYWYGVGQTADPSGNGFIIPLTENNGAEGNFDDTVYTGDEIVITIPDSMDAFTCDVGNLTIWCRANEAFFSVIEVDVQLFTNNPLEVDYEPNRILCNRPSTRPGVLVGELPTSNPRAISGTFYIVDRESFFIQLFSYDADRENVFIYYFPPGVARTEDGEGGLRIWVSSDNAGFVQGRMNSYYNQNFTIDVGLAMGDPIYTCDVGTISIIDVDIGETLTYINIPANLFDEDAGDGTIRCVPGTAGSPPAFSTLGLFGALAVSLLALLFKA